MLGDEKERILVVNWRRVRLLAWERKALYLAERAIKRSRNTDTKGFIPDGVEAPARVAKGEERRVDACLDIGKRGPREWPRERGSHTVLCIFCTPERAVAVQRNERMELFVRVRTRDGSAPCIVSSIGDGPNVLCNGGCCCVVPDGAARLSSPRCVAAATPFVGTLTIQRTVQVRSAVVCRELAVLAVQSGARVPFVNAAERAVRAQGGGNQKR